MMDFLIVNGSALEGLRYFRDMEIGRISIGKAGFMRVLVDKDVYVWTAMISGLASHGRCKEATEGVERMDRDDGH
ncbi:pentatricopeptide repeat-containing protein [Tanacetum coccineum]